MRGKAWLPYLLSALCCSGHCLEGKEKPKPNLRTDQLAPMTANEREADYYRIVDIPAPVGAVLEAGSFAEMGSGRLSIGSRRGDVYNVQGANVSPAKPVYSLIASGMTEILGLASKDGVLFATQQGEITRLKKKRAAARASMRTKL